MDSSQIGTRASSYAGVLQDAGLSCFEYVEQLTLLLLLEMADQFTEPPYNRATVVPPEHGWKALLRLPTGIWYSPGVKANVIFFDKKEGRAEAWTDKLWVYDLRTNMHFTLKQKPIQRTDFTEFEACYKPGRLHERQPTWSDDKPDGRWRCYDYEDLLKRDKLSLDLFWIKDKSLTDTDSPPAPDIIAAEIADDLEAVLEQFTKIAARLARPVAS